MSILVDIVPGLTKFIYSYLGELKVHELGGEFLGTPYKASNPFFNKIDDVVHQNELFNAWLWYDYSYKGKSMLQWYALKGKGLSASTKQDLNQLIDTQHFSLFEFGVVKPGNIECIDLISGTHYHIREYSLASQIQTGQISLLRIFLNKNRWEITMPNGSIVPVTYSSEEMVNDLVSELPTKITMKETPGYYGLLADLGIKGDKSNRGPIDERPTKKQAAKDLEAAIVDTGINKYIASERAKKAIEQDYKDKDNGKDVAPSKSIRMLMGLADREGTNDVERIMQAAGAYWNSLIPAKKLKKAAKKGASDPVIGRYHLQGWQELAQEAEEYYKAGTPESMKKASQAYDDMFANMSENYHVTPSVYRSATNAGLARLYIGDRLLGGHLIERALVMCPDYGLALGVKAELVEGKFDIYAFDARAAEDEEAKKRGELPFGRHADEDELRRLSDTRLIERFGKCGVEIDPATFGALAGKHVEQYDVAEALNPKDESIDYIYGMLTIAHERWAPDVIWVDDVHEAMADFVEFIMDAEYLDEIVAGQIIEKLLILFDKAPKSVLELWQKSFEYSFDRLNLAGGTIAIGEIDEMALFVEAIRLCDNIFEQSRDPIFKVPSIDQDILTEKDKSKKEAIMAAQAGKLKYDYGSMLVIGDSLSDDHPIDAMYAYELAIKALEERISKKKWEYKPYATNSILHDYEEISNLLLELYGKNNDNKTKTKAKKLKDRINTLKDDKRLSNSQLSQKLDIVEREILKERYGDNPILNYLDWFDSLGIDLTGGDSYGSYYGKRKNTKTITNVKKVGRNEPCPCGATKKDGKKPMKYKHCHSKNTN